MIYKELIRKKRDGHSLSSHDIDGFIKGVTNNTIPEYQITAMLMAVAIRGLDDEELIAWVTAMTQSGSVFNLSKIDKPKIDKHSTGGVGDKISIPLAPAAAACGLAVPMISGHGLEHTGGTLDKLESIPGFRVNLTITQMEKILSKIGVCIMEQTERIVPADRILYALRDVTGTAESIPLIASSIMSKKLAEDIDGLVIDCKMGQGALMKNKSDTFKLIEALKLIAKHSEKEITIVLTDMNDPIGNTVGNALEIEESIDVLKGEGPGDTKELIVVLGAEMLLCGGLCDTSKEGEDQIREVLNNGKALEVFRSLIEIQGGDPNIIDKPKELLPQAKHSTPILAPSTGVITEVLSEKIAKAALILGGGKETKADVIDPSVGVEFTAKRGTHINKGDPMAFVRHNGHRDDEAIRYVQEAYKIKDPSETTDSRIINIFR